MTRELPGTSLADLTDRQVRMVSAPLATVTELAFELLGHPLGSPAAWPGAVREALHPGDLALLGSVYGGEGASFIPLALLPRSAAYETTFEDELECLALDAVDGLEPELVAAGLAGSDAWSPALRSPRRWVGGYVAALRRAWTGVRPLWDQARPLIDREVERVGAALVSGSFSHLMASLSPRGLVEDDRWYVVASDPPARMGDGLVLQPLLMGPGARLVGERDGEVTFLAYPLPGARRLAGDTRPRHRETRLGALLGDPRADILRVLDRPTSAGRLAAELIYAPSAITHHVSALERAGLVARERQGRHVLVHRTARGTALLQVYEP